MRRLVQRFVNVKRLWRERSYPTQNQSKAVPWGSETGHGGGSDQNPFQMRIKNPEEEEVYLGK